jgi:predicted HD superfamily hydrolase involved in NAD metabolism
MPVFTHLINGLSLQGDVRVDVPALLKNHGCPKTAEHVAQVAAEARRLAIRTGANPDQAEIAGWLHDVSAIIPNTERVSIARQVGIDVLPEEERLPMILHQKLSAVLGRELFSITDEAILSAVSCHTTLKKDASLLDKVVFVADKIAWDQDGEPPYLADVLAGLDDSIDHAALAYMRYLWDQPLLVIHPWLREAYGQLSDEA